MSYRKRRIKSQITTLDPETGTSQYRIMCLYSDCPKRLQHVRGIEASVVGGGTIAAGSHCTDLEGLTRQIINAEEQIAPANCSMCKE